MGGAQPGNRQHPTGECNAAAAAAGCRCLALVSLEKMEPQALLEIPRSPSAGQPQTIPSNHPCPADAQPPRAALLCLPRYAALRARGEDMPPVAGHLPRRGCEHWMGCLPGFPSCPPARCATSGWSPLCLHPLLRNATQRCLHPHSLTPPELQMACLKTSSCSAQCAS